MVEVSSTSRELTKVEQYKMTLGKEIKVLKDVPDNTMIEPDAWCFYTDTKDDGEEVNLMSILDKDGTVYSCQSQTFKKTFDDISSIFLKSDDTYEPFSIKKISGVTKAGRPYIDCVLLA